MPSTGGESHDTQPQEPARFGRASSAVADSSAKPTWHTNARLLAWIAIVALALTAFGAVGTYFGWAPWSTAQFRAAQAQRKFAIFLPLYCQTQEYLEYVRFDKPLTFYSRSRPPKRKVARDMWVAASAAAKQWQTAHPAGNRASPTVELVAFPEGYDAASYRTAFALALKAATDNDLEPAISIGHATSSVAEAYAELYGSPKIQMPVLITLATATDLVDRMAGQKVPGALRLVPSNDNQAQNIADFLRALKALRVLVVTDQSNSVYSNDLIERFREHFVRQPIARKQADSGSLVGVFPAGQGNAPPFIFPNVNRLSSQAFLLFGMTETILETLSQARLAGLWPGTPMLADGAIDEYLLTRLENVMALTPPPAEPSSKNQRQAQPEAPTTVYLSFPLPEPFPDRLRDLLDRYALDVDQADFTMTHSVYAADAVTIAASLIKTQVLDAAERIDPRVGLSAAIEELRSRRKMLRELIEPNLTLMGSYKFDEGGGGNNVGMEYHIYSVTFSSAAPNPGWVHDPRCPACVRRAKIQTGSTSSSVVAGQPARIPDAP